MSVSSHKKTSVIVHNFHFVRVAPMPAETNAPLVVDANAVLALSPAAQSLKSVAWWGGHIFNT